MNDPMNKAGDVVNIFNHTAGGKLIVEGSAKLLEYRPGTQWVDGDGIVRESWYVSFKDEPGSRILRNVERNLDGTQPDAEKVNAS